MIDRICLSDSQPGYRIKVVCFHNLVKTVNREPPFSVPIIFVGPVVPSNLSEQQIGNQQDWVAFMSQPY